MRISKSKTIIILLYSTYSLAFWLGIYGFGIDYYGAYGLGNISNWGGIDKLGFAVASLYINGWHFGVLIVTLLISISIHSQMEDYFTKNNFSLKNHLIIYIFLFSLVLHSWPVVMSNVNVMRQGLMMAMLYIAISSFQRKKYKRAWLEVLIMIFMHKSSVVYFFYIVSSYLLSLFEERLKFSFVLKNTIMLLYASSSVLMLLYIIPLYFNNHEESRSIGLDFGIAFIIINIAYIFSYYLLFSSSVRGMLVSKVLLFNSFVSPIFLFYGFNWEYERLNMVLLILYIFNFSYIFPRSLRLSYLMLSFLLLVFLTIWAGMFASLK